MSSYVSLYGDGGLGVDLHATDTTPEELTELAGRLAVAFGARSDSPNRGVYVSVIGDADYVDRSIRQVRIPSREPFRLDAALAHDIAIEAGFDLQYLHWCPPMHYNIDEVSVTGPRIEPEFGCLIWNEETGFGAVNVTLDGHRSALAPNMVLHLGMLASAAAAVVIFLTKSKKRKQPWFFWIALWFALFIVAWPIGGAVIPPTPDVLAIEPRSGFAGGLIDYSLGFIAWAGALAGPAVLLMVIVTSLSRGLRRRNTVPSSE
jgi:hypothetical protein